MNRAELIADVRQAALWLGVSEENLLREVDLINKNLINPRTCRIAIALGITNNRDKEASRG